MSKVIRQFTLVVSCLIFDLTSFWSPQNLIYFQIMVKRDNNLCERDNRRYKHDNLIRQSDKTPYERDKAHDRIIMLCVHGLCFNMLMLVILLQSHHSKSFLSSAVSL